MHDVRRGEATRSDQAKNRKKKGGGAKVRKSPLKITVKKSDAIVPLVQTCCLDLDSSV